MRTLSPSAALPTPAAPPTAAGTPSSSPRAELALHLPVSHPASPASRPPSPAPGAVRSGVGLAVRAPLRPASPGHAGPDPARAAAAPPSPTASGSAAASPADSPIPRRPSWGSDEGDALEDPEARVVALTAAALAHIRAGSGAPGLPDVPAALHAGPAAPACIAWSRRGRAVWATLPHAGTTLVYSTQAAACSAGLSMLALGYAGAATATLAPPTLALLGGPLGWVLLPRLLALPRRHGRSALHGAGGLAVAACTEGLVGLAFGAESLRALASAMLYGTVPPQCDGTLAASK